MLTQLLSDENECLASPCSHECVNTQVNSDKNPFIFWQIYFKITSELSLWSLTAQKFWNCWYLLTLAPSRNIGTFVIY